MPKPKPRSLPRNLLRELRERKGWSQATCAEICEVSRPLWTAWENGRRPMKAHQVERVAKLFALDNKDQLKLFRWASRPIDPYPSADIAPPA
jgi:transcriptional regulator with XRE-family HTH domain